MLLSMAFENKQKNHHKNYQLDEPDMRDTAGEVGTSS